MPFRRRCLPSKSHFAWEIVRAACSSDEGGRIISANFHRGGRLVAGFGIWFQVWGVGQHPCAGLKSG